MVPKATTRSALRRTTHHIAAERVPAMNRSLSLPLLAAAATLAVGVPTAGAATLHGTTKGGNEITLKRSGNQVSKIRTLVPTMCAETTGSGQTRAGGEL